MSGNYLYAIGSNADGTAGAILRSNNSGTTWNRYDNIQHANEAGELELVRPDFGITCFGALTHRSLIVGTTDGQLLSDRIGTRSATSLAGVESETPVKSYVAMDFTYEVINTAGAEKAVTGCIAAILEDGAGIVWYTDDGASTSHLSETAMPGIPVSIANNGTEFFLTTSEGKIFISEDAGKTWTENFTVPGGAVVTRMAFADAAKGVALAGNTLYFTGDGGNTWTPATVPGTESAAWKDAAWNGEQLVVAGKDGNCFMSTDGGETFKKQEGFEGDLGAVSYKAFEKVYNVLCTGGEAYRMTAKDKVSGYTAGVYDVESDTWTPLRSTGYLEGQTLSSPYDMSPDGRYIVGNIRDLDGGERSAVPPGLRDRHTRHRHQRRRHHGSLRHVAQRSLHLRPRPGAT